MLLDKEKNKELCDMCRFIEFLYDSNHITKKEMNVFFLNLIISLESYNSILINKDRNSGISTFMLFYCLYKFDIGNSIIIVRPNKDSKNNLFEMFSKTLENIQDTVKNDYFIDIKNKICINKKYNNFFKILSEPEEYSCMKISDIIFFDECFNIFFNKLYNSKSIDFSFDDEDKEKSRKFIYSGNINENICQEINFFKALYDCENNDISINVDFPWYANEKNCKNLCYEKEITKNEKKFKCSDNVSMYIDYDEFITDITTLDLMISDGWNLSSDYLKKDKSFEIKNIGYENLFHYKEYDAPKPIQEETKNVLYDDENILTVNKDVNYLVKKNNNSNVLFEDHDIKNMLENDNVIFISNGKVINDKEKIDKIKNEFIKILNKKIY